jgi:hypothetical protein
MGVIISIGGLVLVTWTLYAVIEPIVAWAAKRPCEEIYERGLLIAWGAWLLLLAVMVCG